mmetsp:Transcript_33353/g.95330  ORF Transcript_33353/g.95330 Transcript_33353/m.95330 type:complete len:227 (-) Transcript_33353:740-1420(-)
MPSAPSAALPSRAAATASSCSSRSVWGTSLPLSTFSGSKSIDSMCRLEAAESQMCCNTSILPSRGSGHSSLMSCRKPVACFIRQATSCTNLGGGRASSSRGDLFLWSSSRSTSLARTDSVPSTVSSTSAGVHSCRDLASREAPAGVGGADAAAAAAGPPSSWATDLSSSRSGPSTDAPGTSPAPRRSSSISGPIMRPACALSSAALASACCASSCKIRSMSSSVWA